MDALDSYDVHNTDDYDDDFSSDDFNEDAYAYDLIQNKLKTLIKGNNNNNDNNTLHPRDRQMLYIDINNIINQLDIVDDKEYLQLISSLFNDKHVTVIGNDLEKKDRGLRFAALNLFLFCLQNQLPYCNNNKDNEEENDTDNTIYEPYILNLKLFLKRLNTSRTYNFYIIQKGKYYNNIVDKWKKSGPYTTLSAYIRNNYCTNEFLPPLETLKSLTKTNHDAYIWSIPNNLNDNVVKNNNKTIILKDPNKAFIGVIISNQAEEEYNNNNNNNNNIALDKSNKMNILLDNHTENQIILNSSFRHKKNSDKNSAPSSTPSLIYGGNNNNNNNNNRHGINSSKSVNIQHSKSNGKMLERNLRLQAMIEETLQSTKYEVMQKKKKQVKKMKTVQKNKAMLLLEKEITRVEIERRMLKQEEQIKFRQNKNNNSNIMMNEHDYHYNSNSDKEIGGEDNTFDNYYYNNDEMDTPSALRFQQMKAYLKNKVDSNKDNLKKKNEERDKHILWTSRRNRVLAKKRRAAGAKTSKLKAKQRQRELNKKMKDARVRRAMQIYDDYTNALEKGLRTNNTNQKIGQEKHRHNNNNNNKRHDTITKNTRIRSKRKKNKQKNALKQQQQLSSLYTKKASKQNDIQISPRALREAYDLALRKLEINVDPQSRNNNNASSRSLNHNPKTENTNKNKYRTDAKLQQQMKMRIEEKQEEEQDKEELKQLQLEKIEAMKIYNELLPKDKANDVNHIPIETIELKNDLKPRPPPWDLKGTSYGRWPEKQMSRRVSKYVQNYLVNAAEEERKANERRKPGSSIGGGGRFKFGEGYNNIDDGLSVMTQESIKKLIDSQYYKIDNNGANNYTNNNTGLVIRNNGMMNMNDSHDSRNDDDDDIKFISNKKDNNYKNILFTPQIPKMERKNSHRKAFQHLQRETIHQGRSPLTKFRKVVD